jgi:glycosyltransferase involved in cell wall biosynthesis
MDTNTEQSPLWLVDDAPIMGGAERFALRLCRWLQGAHPARPIRIICPDQSELARAARLADYSVAPFDFPVPGAATLLAWALGVARLRRLFAESPPDTLIVANAARAQAYAIPAWASLRGGRRLVSVMHEQDSARRATARWVLRRFGGVAAVGDGGVTTYRAALKGVPVARVTNLLEPEELQRMVDSRRPAPAGDRAMVGVLSRMYPGKGVIELVDELAQTRGAWHTARIAAPFQDSDYTATVRRRIAAHDLHDEIALLGDVSDVAGFIAEVDVVVVPSIATEGQPTAVLEALACGRPALVRPHVWQSDYAGLPVITYANAVELGDVLRAQHPNPVPAEELSRRFDPEAVLKTLEQTARAWPGRV